MQKLRCIAYVSTAAVPFSTEKLEWLLGECKLLNLAHDVTGVLLYHDGSFMQYFEGPPEFIPETYRRILNSRCHRNIIELVDMPIEKRSFASWEMGLGRPTRSELLAISSARWTKMANEPFVDDAPLGLDLLKRFWKTTRN